MINLKGICKNYKVRKGYEQLIFENMDFEMKHEKSVSIEGRSGAGKTTLLKIMAGLDIDYTGQYVFDDTPMEKCSTEMSWFRFNNIGLITQNYDLLYDRTIFNNVAISLYGSGMSKSEIKKEVIKALEIVGMLSMSKKYPNELSGGECQKIAIARAICKTPSLLLADEPTAALDVDTEEEILDVFKCLQDKGQKIILVTHSDVVAEICDVRYKISDKKLAKV